MANANTQAASSAFHSNLAQKATPRNIYRVSNKPGAGNINVNFPVGLGTPDEQDERYFTQQSLVNEQGIVPGIGQAIVGPDYFDYVKRKEEVGMFAQFQEWLMNQASFDTPEQSEYWYKHHPWMLEKRVNEVERVANLQQQLAKINIGGPQTEDDWKLLFALEKGLVVVPNTAPHMLGMNEQGDYISKNYRQGMFSPMITDPPGGINPPKKLNTLLSWSNPIAPGAANPQAGITYPLGISGYASYIPSLFSGRNP